MKLLLFVISELGLHSDFFELATGTQFVSVWDISQWKYVILDYMILNSVLNCCDIILFPFFTTYAYMQKAVGLIPGNYTRNLLQLFLLSTHKLLGPNKTSEKPTIKTDEKNF